MGGRGIKNAVFVQCYNDCPEEIDWVFKQVSAILRPRAGKYILKGKKHMLASY